jgi:hypothetical protein
MAVLAALAVAAVTADAVPLSGFLSSFAAVAAATAASAFASRFLHKAACH